jgi:hypothetical protein
MHESITKEIGIEIALSEIHELVHQQCLRVFQSHLLIHMYATTPNWRIGGKEVGMRTIQYFVVAATLVLSVGTAMAATDEQQVDAKEFYALSFLTGEEAQSKKALTDEELATIKGRGTGGLLTSSRMFNPQPEPPKYGDLIKTKVYR